MSRTLLFFGIILIIILSITVQCTKSNSKALTKKASLIHKKVLTLDSHADTPLTLYRSDYDLGVRHEISKEGGRVDFPRMKEGGLDASFFAVFIGQGPRTAEGNEKAKQKALDIFNKIYEAVDKRSDLAKIALTPQDAYRIEKAGKRAVYMGIENGYPVGKDLSLIQKFYDLGARYITLCHTQNNDICDSSTDKKGPEHSGLSKFGEQVVAEMNRLGIIVDISHISDEAVEDVLAVSKTPVIASHSCARALRDVPRNLNDELLKKIAEKGGVVQVCLMTDYLGDKKQEPEREVRIKELRQTYTRYSELSEEEREKLSEKWWEVDQKYPENLASVSDLVDHIDHIVKAAGINHVGIGSDFDGGAELADCQDVSEMGNITKELIKRGYSEEQIRKIWAGNFMRVFSDVEKFAGKESQ